MSFGGGVIYLFYFIIIIIYLFIVLFCFAFPHLFYLFIYLFYFILLFFFGSVSCDLKTQNKNNTKNYCGNVLVFRPSKYLAVFQWVLSGNAISSLGKRNMFVLLFVLLRLFSPSLFTLPRGGIGKLYSVIVTKLQMAQYIKHTWCIIALVYITLHLNPSSAEPGYTLPLQIV